MDLMERRRWLIEAQSEIPMLYRRVEYIASEVSSSSNAATQYIDTGYSPASVTDMMIVMEPQYPFSDTEGSVGRRMAGVANLFRFGTARGFYYMVYLEKDMQKRISMRSYDAFVGKHTYRLARGLDGGFWVDDTKLASFSSVVDYQTDETISIGRINPDATDAIACKIFSVIIKEGNELKRNMIPCIRKSDNKPGLYDTVSKTFYTNAGTGEFIVPT